MVMFRAFGGNDGELYHAPLPVYIEEDAGLWEVIDRHTGARVGKALSKAGARRKVDKLDNIYGAYRYHAQRVI